MGELDLEECLTRSNQKEGCQTAGSSLNMYVAMGKEIWRKNVFVQEFYTSDLKKKKSYGFYFYFYK